MKLLNEMVVKLKSSRLVGKRNQNSDSLNDSFVMRLAMALRAARLEPDQAKKRKGDVPPPVHTSYREEQEAYREILKIIVGRALSLTQTDLSALEKSNQLEYLISNLEYLMPDIEELLPSQALMIPRKLDQMERSLDTSIRELRKEFRKLDNSEEESAKEDSTTPASESVEVFKVYYQEQMRVISSSPSLEEQAARLAGLANRAIEHKAEKEAREALEKAMKIVGNKMVTARQVSIQITIAKAWVEIDPNRSFEIIAAVMKRIDRLYIGVKEYIVFLTGGDNYVMNDNFGTPLVFCTIEIAPMMQRLAAQDFDRAAEIIGQEPINYLRLMIAVSFLEKVLGAVKTT